MYTKREKRMTAGETARRGGSGNSAVSCSFPQWSVRLRPTSTKNCVLDQGIAYNWEAEGEGQGGDCGQRAGQERTSASSASSVHLRSLHLSLHRLPPSILPLLLPPSQQLAGFHPSRERRLWWRRLSHQYVFRHRTVSVNSPWIHTHCLLSPLAPSSLSTPRTVPPISSDSSPHPLLFPLILVSFPFLVHLSFPLRSLTLLLSLSLLSPGLFGPAFQSSFNWLGVTSSWDNRSSPPGEIDTYRYWARSTPTGLHRY